MEEETQSGIVKKYLYINRRAPHGTIYAHEALETVLIGAAFEQDVTLVFIDDGVFQLKKNQDTSEIGTKNFSKTFYMLCQIAVQIFHVRILSFKGSAYVDFKRTFLCDCYPLTKQELFSFSLT